MTTPRRLFDRYVMVDWSANSKPKTGKDSIWIRSLGSTDESYDLIENPRTRVAARDRVREELAAAILRKERVLVGFDFPYGYPRGFARALGLSGLPWRAIWRYLSDSIVDGPDNANNRFAVAAGINRRLSHHTYWACPPAHSHENLSTRKDLVRYNDAVATALPEWRETELALKARRIHPQSVWKLHTAGSVGGQALVGIPVVAALRDDPELQLFSKVWPLETTVPELVPAQPAIVHAEIWPSVIDVTPAMRRPENVGKVRDQVQVEELATHLRALDENDQLRDLLAAGRAGADDEGWILGAW